MTYQQQDGNLEPLDGSEVRLELELGQNDNLITPIGTGMADDHQRIDVTLRK